MNFQMLGLDKAIDQDSEYDKAMLIKEGVLTSENRIVKNELNLTSGAYASSLLDAILEADMNPQVVIEYIESLHQQNQHMGIYHFLLYLFAALEMDAPYLFMQLPHNPAIIREYHKILMALFLPCPAKSYGQIFAHLVYIH